MTLAVLFVASIFVVVLLLIRSRTEAKLHRQRERIYLKCLKQRPPLSFAKSEFIALLRSRRRQGVEQEEDLVNAVLQAVDWCFEILSNQPRPPPVGSVECAREMRAWREGALGGDGVHL